MACTTILVGKLASHDGSTMVARNEDTGAGSFCPKNFQVVKPEDQVKKYKSVISKVEIDLPDNPLQYTHTRNAFDNEGIWGAYGVNSKNVSMTATETITNNERLLAADPLVVYQKAEGKEGEADYQAEKAGGIGEEDMVTIVLPYITSAREGVERLGKLLEEYGTYEMNAIAFQDLDEIWWMETIGGHHWYAKRVPDTHYVVMPNQLGIDNFDLWDAEHEQIEHMASADLREFILENHLNPEWSIAEIQYILSEEIADDDFEDYYELIDNEFEDYFELDDEDEDSEVEIVVDEFDDEDEDIDDDADFAIASEFEDEDIINPRLVFGTSYDSDHSYNTPRAWVIQRFFNPKSSNWDGEDAEYKPCSDDIPWSRIAERKITPEDIKYALSNHYQGTPYDPYRKCEQCHTHQSARPIGINRTSTLGLVQLRPYLPEECRALEWVTYGCNVFNTMIPFYTNIDKTPEYMDHATSEISTDNYYWVNRLIGALADAHYAQCSNHVERYQIKTVVEARKLIREYDNKILEVLAKNNSDNKAKEASKILCQEANEKLAAMLKKESNELLAKVLFEASLKMKTSFNRSDA